MPSYNSYYRPSISRERRSSGYLPPLSSRSMDGHTNDAKPLPRTYQPYIHPARSSPPQGKYPSVPPLIHQNYRPSRRWPPAPVVEDEAISLSKEYRPSLSDRSTEEARCRGEIDQQPMIIAVHVTPSISTIDGTSPKSNSSSEFSSPRTPLDDEGINIDRRYVYIPEKGIEIPSTYNEPRTPKYEKKASIPGDMDDSRSRKELARLETDLSSGEPLRDRPSRHERAPSPYAYTPTPSKSIRDPFIGESLGSADVMGPKVGFHAGGTRTGTSAVRPSAIRPGQGIGTQAAPPLMTRHVSDNGYPAEYPTDGKYGIAAQSTPYPLSSDESDLSDVEISPTRMPKGLGLNSPQSPPKYSMPRHGDFSKRRTDRELPHDATWSPAMAESVYQKRVPPTHVRIPSSPRLKSGSVQPLSPGMQLREMPQPSPTLRYDKMSPSSPRYERYFSPHGSVTITPTSSPPATAERMDTHSADYTSNAINILPGVRHPSRSGSRPESPEQHFGSPESRNAGSSMRDLGQPVSNSRKPQSPTRSRSPSPGIRSASYIQALPSIGVREPSPARPENIPRAAPEAMPAPLSQPTNVTLFLTPQQPFDLERPVSGARRRTLSNVETRPKISLSVPRSETLVRPPPSPQAQPRSASHHRTVSFGSQPLAMLPCLRPSPVAGHTDWYSLVGNSSFSICPSCRRTVFGAGYENYFQPSRPDASDSKRRCDMGTPWMRMALLVTMSAKRPDPRLLHGMANIIVNELPCPAKRPTAGSWFRIVSPEDGKQVSGFNVCPCCVRNIETMFPTLTGVFQRSKSRRPDQERSCDLRTDSKRFPKYIDLLESTAKQAQEFKRPPNMLRFADLAEKMVAIPECSRDDMLRNHYWHTMPHIPELTVCEDCYHEVVRPAAREGYSLAADFSREAYRTGPRDVGISCQLYSARMRNTFKEACRRKDIAWLKSVAMQRHRIEADLQRRKRETHGAEIKDDERLERIQGLVDEWKRWE